MADFIEKASGKLTKLSDEQVARLINSLRKEEAFSSSVLECIGSAIIICDKDWHILRMNKVAQRFLPFVKHYPEKNCVVWKLIDNNEISEFVKKIATLKKTNASEEFSLQDEVGKIKFITFSILPLIYDSKINGSIIHIEDITAKKQQEILSHRMDNMQSLTNLAASVAHEIKNPLGAISIHIQLLQKAIKKSRESDGFLPQEKFLEKYLLVINEEIDNLNKTLADFLFAVRPVQAKFELVDADVIARKTVHFFSPEFETKNIEVALNLCNSKKKILIDEKLFREVIINLLKNALATIEEKISLGKVQNCSGKIAINSYIEEKNIRYVLSVADNGMGISEEQKSKIFDPYFTTKANGTGLGLTTVFKIVREFHGELNVESLEGKGSVFLVSIPLLQNKTMLLEEQK